MSVSILIGDVHQKLASLPADHFACALTSPPYWGLRSYLDADHPDKHLEIGCEPTLGEHLEVMVEFCRAVRRVLRPDGVFWLNYGDCYATSPNGRSAADTKATGNDDRTFRDKPFSTVGPIYRGGPPSSKLTLRGNGHVGGGPKLQRLPPVQMRSNGGEGQHHDRRGGLLKPKDLCLIPQRLAIALQEDGWWVRSLLPWVKRNGMPESIRDRPASGVEYVIMLTKSERYAYDAEAVRRPASERTNPRVSKKPDGWDTGPGVHGSFHRNGREKGVTTKQDATAAAAAAAGGSSGRRMSGFNDRWDAQGGVRRAPGVTPKSAGEDTNIKAKGSFHASTTEVLSDRNFRNTDLFFDSLEPPFGLLSAADGLPIAMDVCPQGFKEAHFATFPERFALPLLQAGNPSCGPVLDPFGGAGTVGLVADRLGMDCTLIELNPESAEIARRRIQGDAGMFAEVDAS